MISTFKKAVQVYVKNHSDDIIIQSAVAKKTLVSGTSTLQRSEEYDHKNDYSLSGIDYILCAVACVVGIGMIFYWTYSFILISVKNISKIVERLLKKGDKT